LNLFQTWNSQNLPPKMQNCVNRLKRQNWEFNYHFYDDAECGLFIQKHFDKDVLDTFYRLIPGAYKADLWRYCVLYIHGGIYLDIKFECCDGFKLIELMNQVHYVMDRESMIKTHAEPGKILVYNGCIVSPSNNPILLNCIQKIVHNVEKKEYGMNALYPTGPGLLGDVLGNSFDIDLSFDETQTYILYKNRRILKKYPEYRREQYEQIKTESYQDLWKNRQIYD